MGKVLILLVFLQFSVSDVMFTVKTFLLTCSIVLSISTNTIGFNQRVLDCICSLCDKFTREHCLDGCAFFSECVHIYLLLLLLCVFQQQHTRSDMAGHQKIYLFPVHLFKKLLICCRPIKSLALAEEPIERQWSCETEANPKPHSNADNLYQGTTPSPDTAYL